MRIDVDYIDRARELRKETVAHRRYFHTNAEVGLDTPKAVDYVMERLGEYGLKPERCGHGVTAAVETGGKTLLLRADMDALPMGEESGEPFACPTGTARVYGGTAEVEMRSEVPPLVCDQALTDRMAGYLRELPGLTLYPGVAASASEDFAMVAEQVPAVFMYFSTGFQDERGEAPAHNPKVRFNEDVCAIGPAGLAHCATRWLCEEG